MLDEVEQISFKGATTGDLSGPRARGAYSDGPHDQPWLAPTELWFGTIRPVGFAMELLFT